jgi:hypothetical protein
LNGGLVTKLWQTGGGDEVRKSWPVLISVGKTRWPVASIARTKAPSPAAGSQIGARGRQGRMCMTNAAVRQSGVDQ